MRWVRENTSIPLPAIVRYDDTESNVIRHEFTVLEKAPGASVDRIYSILSQDTRTKLVSQLVDYLCELHAHPWVSFVGGLSIREGDISPGPYR